MVLRDGLRAEKSSGTLYWRTYTGQVIEARSLRPERLYGKTNTSGGMQRDYIFLGGRRIAWDQPNGSGGWNVYYYFADAVGSTRAATNATGTVCFSADYYPYGQENDYSTSCSPTYKFAGYEFDSETGNYYAYARYYSPQYGRFISPDPLGGSVDNPQSLNRYTYVLNNPESLVDPLGMGSCPAGEEEQTNSSGETGCVPIPVTMVFVNGSSGGTTSTGGSTYCVINTDPQGPGNYQAEPEAVCRLYGGEGGVNDNMMGPTLMYGTETEFTQYLLQLVQGMGQTAEDRQIQALSNAVAADAGYATHWQFWAEWTGLSTGGALLSGAADAYLAGPSLEGAALPALSGWENSSVVAMQTGFPGGPAAFGDFLSGVATPSAPGTVAAAIGYGISLLLGGISH